MAHRHYHRHDKYSVVLEVQRQVADRHRSTLDLCCFRSTLDCTLVVGLVDIEDCIALDHDQKGFSLPMLCRDMVVGLACDDGERS